MKKSSQKSSKKPSNKYWDNLKEFGIAGISVATGDPEAIKTMIEVLANATHLGLEKVKLKSASKEAIKKKLEKAVDSGADSLMQALDTYQRKAEESNKNLRAKYGRMYKKNGGLPKQSDRHQGT